MSGKIEIMLDIPDVEVIKCETETNGDIIIMVKSSLEGTQCHKCGSFISKPYGSGREIDLRHMSILGRRTYIRICPPRYQCTVCEKGPVSTQTSQWYDQGSPNTLAYEDHVLLQLISSTVEDVSMKENLGYEAVMGIISRRINAEVNWENIERIDVVGMDEISLKKGHKNYVTIVTALTGGKLNILAVLKDREKKTVKEFLNKFPKRLRKKIRGVCSDMYEGFINAAKEVFGKKITVVIDRFHVARLYRAGLDGLRKTEQKRLKQELNEAEYKKLKGAMWALRKNPEKLTDEEKNVLECLFSHSPKLKLAYDLCSDLTNIFDENISKTEAGQVIDEWIKNVRASGLECFDGFLKTLKKWKDEITNYFINRDTSGFVEGLNNKIKVIKRRCYGIFNVTHLFQRIFLDLEGYSLFAN